MAFYASDFNVREVARHLLPRREEVRERLDMPYRCTLNASRFAKGERDGLGSSGTGQVPSHMLASRRTRRHGALRRKDRLVVALGRAAGIRRPLARPRVTTASIAPRPSRRPSCRRRRRHRRAELQLRPHPLGREHAQQARAFAYRRRQCRAALLLGLRLEDLNSTRGILPAAE